MRRFHSREFGNEKSPGIPGARETGAREWKLYSRPRGIPKRTRTEVVQKDCQACKLNGEDAMNHSRWRKNNWYQDRCEWVNVSSGTGSPGESRKKGHKTVAVLVNVNVISNYMKNHTRIFCILQAMACTVDDCGHIAYNRDLLHHIEAANRMQMPYYKNKQNSNKICHK